MIRNFGFILILITVTLLLLLCILLLVGFFYAWDQTATDFRWRMTTVFSSYVYFMNIGMLSFMLALVAIVGLCIPRRLFRNVALLKFMALASLVSLGIGIGLGYEAGIISFLSITLLIQIVSMLLTMVGDKSFGPRTQAFFLKIGSTAMHLGLLLFLADMAFFIESPSHMNIFWLSLTFILGGMSTCLYLSLIHI